ncbi:DUF4947 domain-containing protein [Carnobacterium maltaromaticum]|uniref:DUF4947 domain-containing protein n=1 Tax=Carnobacterium maltaromaticum TaxID=2751 RepID=UPI001F3F325D|nr:DUF4947 domain-containing protein [Carnobacterium maltaromaticum]
MKETDSELVHSSKKKRDRKKKSTTNENEKKDSSFQNQKEADSTQTSEVLGNTFRPNPAEADEEVMYESDGEGQISAVIPDYSHYTKEQVIELLGEPSSVVTDSSEIQSRLEGNEWQLIKAEFEKGKLTESQAKAFIFASADLGIAVGFNRDIELLVYEDQDKPNVYLTNGQVDFITPLTDYIEFNGKLQMD